MALLGVAGNASMSIATPAAAAAVSWTLQTEPGLNGTLLDVSCPTITNCTAVGYESKSSGSPDHAVIWSWGPAGWKPEVVAPGAAATLLDSVSCVTISTCIAVGTTGNSPYSVAMRRGRWGQVPMPADNTGSSAPAISSVSCQSRSSCMAVGVELPSEHPLAYSFNGTRWLDRSVPSKLRYAVLKSVSCDGTATLDCTAVGTAVAPPTPFASSQKPLPAVLRFQGASSKPVAVPVNNAGLNAVVCIDSSCVAGGAVGTRADTPLVVQGQMRGWVRGGTPSTRDASSILRLSCVGTTASCAAVASGTAANGREVIETLRDGHWNLQRVALPRVAFSLGGISCVAANAGSADCMLVGSERTSAGFQENFAVRGTLVDER